MVWWEGHTSFKVKSAKILCPNVLSFNLLTGTDQFYVVDCYIAPTNKTMACYIWAALDQCLKGFHPLLLGDLNACLWMPVSMRDNNICNMVDAAGLTNLSRHFTCQGK